MFAYEDLHQKAWRVFTKSIIEVTTPPANWTFLEFLEPCQMLQETSVTYVRYKKTQMDRAY